MTEGAEAFSALRAISVERPHRTTPPTAVYTYASRDRQSPDRLKTAPDVPTVRKQYGSTAQRKLTVQTIRRDK